MFKLMFCDSFEFNGISTSYLVGNKWLVNGKSSKLTYFKEMLHFYTTEMS